jgi:AraC-like DNA-binding protein
MMESYKDNYNIIQFEFPLDDDHVHTGTVMHFQRWIEAEGEIDLGLEEDFLGMVVNLSRTSVSYRFDRVKGTLAKAHFNFFHIPKNQCTLVLKEGLASLLFWKCTRAFLEQFECETELLAPFLNRARAGMPAAMNTRNHPIVHEMLDDVAAMMSMKDFRGTARSMYLRAKASNMLICGIMNSHQHFLKQIGDSNVLSIQEVYQYMVDNLKFIRSTSTLAIKAKMPEQRFRDVFRSLFGKSVQEAMRLERLKRAVDLLLTTQLAIHQIGVEVGYSSASAFLEAFRERYGVYPTEFREKYRSGG